MVFEEEGSVLGGCPLGQTVILVSGSNFSFAMPTAQDVIIVSILVSDSSTSITTDPTQKHGEEENKPQIM